MVLAVAAEHGVNTGAVVITVLVFVVVLGGWMLLVRGARKVRHPIRSKRR